MVHRTRGTRGPEPGPAGLHRVRDRRRDRAGPGPGRARPGRLRDVISGGPVTLGAVLTANETYLRELATAIPLHDDFRDNCSMLWTQVKIYDSE